MAAREAIAIPRRSTVNVPASAARNTSAGVTDH